jgi:hypothetical protein
MNDRQKIIDARSNDTALFYKIINQQRGRLTRFIDELQVDGSTFQTPEYIMNGWRIHFGQLAKTSTTENFDNDYLKLMEQEMDVIMQICQDQVVHKEVCNEELLKAVRKRNTNKAADYFGITAENVINGSVLLLNYLQNLINVSFKNCHIPDILKIGTIFPVYKNKGDIKNAKNYRGIIVTPTFSKIIEKIVKIREDFKIIDTQNALQKGFTEKSVPLLCYFFIVEFDRESKDLDLPTYIGFLDSKSAFDVVVHANLIRRLFQIGISKQSILMINSVYQNAAFCMKWNNQMSNTMFKIEQEVRKNRCAKCRLI